MTAEHEELERHNRVPLGFLALFFGLIAWGIYYIAAYTPEISGWSQYRVLAAQAERERASARAVPHENPYERDPKAAAEGGVLFGEHCAGCHGKDMKGGVGPDLTGHLSFGETNDALFRSIQDGRPGGMPAFGTQLGKDRIWKVVAYIDSVREGAPEARK